jgi:hypothetical protein
MKITILSTIVLLAALCPNFSDPFITSNAEARFLVTRFASAACGCNDVSGINSRIKGINAVLARLATEARSPTAQRQFDASTFDQTLGDPLMEIMGTNGGIASMVIGDIDRTSCDLETGQNLANVPGIPAGIGGSACLRDGAAVGLNVRRQVCLAGRTAANEGTDYWEGRQMSTIISELTNAYTAEANFLKQQISSLSAACRISGAKTVPVPTPPPHTCLNCVQYIFEGEYTLPMIGTIRMHSNQFISFTVNPDNTISGADSINTTLDTSGSPCKISGFNGVADINIAGAIVGGDLNAEITPRGASQRTSAHMTITCPPKGKAEVFPVQQNYSMTESLKIPVRGQRFTEKQIDLAARTQGMMHGNIILRLFMTPR